MKMSVGSVSLITNLDFLFFLRELRDYYVGKNKLDTN